MRRRWREREEEEEAGGAATGDEEALLLRFQSIGTANVLRSVILFLLFVVVDVNIVVNGGNLASPPPLGSATRFGRRGPPFSLVLLYIHTRYYHRLIELYSSRSRLLARLELVKLGIGDDESHSDDDDG